MVIVVAALAAAPIRMSQRRCIPHAPICTTSTSSTGIDPTCDSLVTDTELENGQWAYLGNGAMLPADNLSPDAGPSFADGPGYGSYSCRNSVGTVVPCAPIYVSTPVWFPQFNCSGAGQAYTVGLKYQSEAVASGNLRLSLWARAYGTANSGFPLWIWVTGNVGTSCTVTFDQWTYCEYLFNASGNTYVEFGGNTFAGTACNWQDALNPIGKTYLITGVNLRVADGGVYDTNAPYCKK